MISRSSAQRVATRWQRARASIDRIVKLSPVLWCRYGIGITSSGGLVSAWADQSGNGNNLVQAIGTNQPALQSDNSILFDGVDNFLSATFTANQPMTHCLLMKQVTWVSNARVISGTGATVIIQQSATTPNLRLNAGSAGTENSDLVLDTYGVVSAVFNGASSIIQINNGTAVTSDAGANNATAISLGASAAAVSPSKIQVKEHIIFPAALDAAARSFVAEYLSMVRDL